MTPAPRLSIGLPVYNGEAYLAESLDSLLAQTFTDFELVISDNASTDATAEICRRYAAVEPRVRYERQPVNIGAAPNHDAVLRAARGELFMWASHDDLYGRDLLARCVAELDAHPEAVLCHADMGVVDGVGRLVEYCEYLPHTAAVDPVERFRSLLYADGGDDEYGVMRTVVARTIAPAASYHHPGRTLVAELALHGTFRHVPEVLYFRRDHPDRGDRLPSIRAVCANLDPRRARHSTARLVAEYVWGYISAVRRAPISHGARGRCLAHLAGWAAARGVARPRTRTAPRAPRIGLFGILGTGNLGNDGSLDAMVTAIRDRRPDVELGFMCMGPDVVSARYGGPAVPLQWYEAHAEALRGVPTPLLKAVGRALDGIRTARWVRGFDAVVVPGMGVLEATLPMRPWSFPFSLFCLTVSGRLRGTPVALVTVGAGPVRKRMLRTVIRGAARRAHVRSYRDEQSRDAVRAMGVDVSGDAVAPDLAFALDVTPTSGPEPRTVGVGLMDYHGDNDERSGSRRLHAHYVDVMTRFVRHLVADGRDVRLFIGDPVDQAVAERVRIAATGPGYGPGSVTVEETPTLAALMERMAAVETVVATRYHNVLAALRVGVPTVSVGYASKNDALMADMGLGGYCQAARSVDLDRLIEQFTDVERRRAELVAVLAERNRTQVARLGHHLDAVLSSMLGARPAAVVPAPRTATRAAAVAGPAA